MRPRLFDSDATVFSTMGIGSLAPISCNVVEEINGTYEMSMVILVTDPLMEQVKIGSIIAAKPNKTDPVQAFCVEHIGKAINGEIEIYATHICQFRGKLIPVNKFTANGLAAAIAAISHNSLEPNPFTITTDKTSSTTMKQDVPHSFRELLGGTEGSLIDTYGGELYYDNFSVKLLSRRGSDEGAQVMYGKNMTEFIHESDFSWNGSATGVKPYYFSDDGYVTSAIKYSRYADLFPYKKTVAMDFTDQFESVPTSSQLASLAQSWINSRGLPAVNLTVAFDQFAEMSHTDDVHIGDTVRIINNVYDVNMTSRIIGTDFNVLAEEYNTITIGDLKDTINDAITSLMDTGDTPKGLNIFPVGSVVVTSTNNAPAYEGTWVLFDKSYKTVISTTWADYVTVNDTNTTSVGSFIFHRSDKMVSIRIRIIPKVAVSDSTLEFCTLDRTAMGMTSMYQIYTVGMSDGGNTLTEIAVTANGVIESLDVFPKTDGSTHPAGQQIDIYFNYAVNPVHMIDSHCDKFFWRRTA